MNPMHMPGFTAEASLYNGNVCYQSTTRATFYGGIVQPAASDVFHPERPAPFLSTQLFYPDRPIRCLKWECLLWNPNDPLHCYPGAWVRRIGVLVGGICV